MKNKVLFNASLPIIFVSHFSFSMQKIVRVSDENQSEDQSELIFPQEFIKKHCNKKNKKYSVPQLQALYSADFLAEKELKKKKRYQWCCVFTLVASAASITLNTLIWTVWKK